MTTIENLPGQVLSEIFIRFLAKELAQMRSVCKPWNALLSDSSFVKSHLHRSIQNNNEILLFVDMMVPLELRPTPFAARLSRFPDLKLPNFIKPPVIPQIKYGYGIVIGSVNGLICFVYGSSRGEFLLHIWNPSLSAILCLPPFPLGSQLHFGFGYDPKADDYKIIKLTSFSPAPNKVAQEEVYSLRKASWKLISSQSFPSHMTIPRVSDNSHVCVNDHLHWLCETDLDPKQETIVAFDLVAETFREIPLPYSVVYYDMNKPTNVLAVLSGKLCVMSRVKGGKCEVWVMNEYVVAESWVKHHAFSQFSGDIKPYGFTSHGEFLFQVGVNDDRFALYDPIAAAKTKTFNDLMSGKYYMMRVVEYVDSLVWVAPPKCESNSCDISQLQIGN